MLLGLVFDGPDLRTRVYLIGFWKEHGASYRSEGLRFSTLRDRLKKIIKRKRRAVLANKFQGSCLENFLDISRVI